MGGILRCWRCADLMHRTESGDIAIGIGNSYHIVGGIVGGFSVVGRVAGGINPCH